MAVTHGQGNPDWTKDETILALNLLFQLHNKNPSPQDERVIQLSTTLNQLPIHPVEVRNDKFRNPVGVSLKIQNLKSVSSGKGLKNGSKIDRIVWEEFGNKPDEVARIAAEIIQVSHLYFQENEHIESEIQDGESFVEGKIITATHRRKERDQKLRKSIIKIRKKNNTVFCDICGLRPYFDKTIDEFSIFECHHIIPLAQTGGLVKTKSKDISFLCANCHKAIHNKIAKEKRWFTPDEIKCLLIKHPDSLGE